MKSVWKFPFEIANRIEVDMPLEADVLLIECQGGMPCIWALVDTNHPSKAREFRIVGSGHGVGEDWNYIASFQQPPFVWHVFEEWNRR